VSRKVKPEDITLEDIRVCISILSAFRKYYERTAQAPIHDRDMLRWLMVQALKASTAKEEEEEEEEIDQELLERIRKKYKHE